MTIAIDGHILTGKYQGTRTFLEQISTRILTSEDDEHYLYASTTSLPYVPSRRIRYIPPMPSALRLSAYYPSRLLIDRPTVSLWQYVPPAIRVGAYLTVVHDILPITHPEYFPRRFSMFFNLAIHHAIRASHKIISVSPYTSEVLRARFPYVPESRIVTGTNGGSFDAHSYLFGEAPQSAEPPYVLMVGRIERRKNIEAAINAFITANVPGVTLKIVGQFDHGYKFRFPPSVEFMQPSRTSLITLYQRAGLFIYPSFAEGFGIPLLDSLMFGLPVITSNATALRDLSAYAALSLDPKSDQFVEDLADAIRSHFITTPLPRPSLAARRALWEAHNWDHMAKLLVDIGA